MTTTVLSVKLDKRLKEDARDVAEMIGFPLSTLVSAYLRQLVHTRRVDFSAPERMTPEMENMIGETDTDIRAGKNLVGPFYTASDFIASLNN